MSCTTMYNYVLYNYVLYNYVQLCLVQLCTTMSCTTMSCTTMYNYVLYNYVLYNYVQLCLVQLCTTMSCTTMYNYVLYNYVLYNYVQLCLVQLCTTMSCTTVYNYVLYNYVLYNYVQLCLVQLCTTMSCTTMYNYVFYNYVLYNYVQLCPLANGERKGDSFTNFGVILFWLVFYGWWMPLNCAICFRLLYSFLINIFALRATVRTFSFQFSPVNSYSFSLPFLVSPLRCSSQCILVLTLRLLDAALVSGELRGTKRKTRGDQQHLKITSHFLKAIVLNSTDISRLFNIWKKGNSHTVFFSIKTVVRAVESFWGGPGK